MNNDPSKLKQQTDEWHKARFGHATGSRIADILAKTPRGDTWGATRINYEAELVIARLTERPIESITTREMQWGIDNEPNARMAYEFMYGVEVQEVGYILHPTIPLSGASPDGLVGEDGLVGFKCPNSATHMATLLGSSIPRKYIYQNQYEMACTGRQWCDWVSYDPRFPENMSLFVERIYRDEDMIREIEKEVRRFLDGVAGKVAKLRKQYGE